MSSLLGLPEEIVLYILALLDPQDVISCQLVCRPLNTLVSASPRLLFSLALDFLGYKLPFVPRSNLGPSASLKLLREHHSNRRCPSNIQPTQHGLRTHSISSKYACSVYAQAFGIRGLLGTSPTVRDLEFYQIPSKNLDTEFKRWSLENLGPGIRDFIFDPDQDLLVLLEFPNAAPQHSPICTIHLRTMSEGKAHPRALVPAMVATFAEGAGLGGGMPSWNYHFEVMGPLIGILFRARSQKRPSWVVVWDWVRGIEVTRISTAGGWHSSFVLLDQQTLLLPSSSRDNLSYTSKFFRNDTIGSIKVYVFDPKANTTTPPRLISSFSLPSLDQKQVRSTLRLRCTPNVRPVHNPYSRPKAYESSSEHTLVGIDVDLSRFQGSGEVTESAGTLYVPASVFLQIGCYTQETSMLYSIINKFYWHSAPEIPWYKWACHTSWVNTGDSKAKGDYLMYGCRMGALSNSVGIMGPASRICLLDFNQHRLKRRKSKMPPVSNRGVEQHSLWSVFAGQEASGDKKYTEATLEVEGGVDIFDEIVLDDEHVILARKGRLGSGPSLLVYTF
ncbi:unnamed protein product [Rhizoctonia solani]|uniref:F-box domain-containing protein n=1 Tax=Rhizoctonia solani TaxID=456999 RepID=A0A8H3HLG9_9AGAM|nr:unnamed protein product [Rhizoctonia solani]